MSKQDFAGLVKTYLKAAGYSQKILANELGMNSSVLTHKLNGTGRFILTYPEIRDIVRTLAKLEAITRRQEAQQLLKETNCPDFSKTDWLTVPLNNLTEEPLSANKRNINDLKGWNFNELNNPVTSQEAPKTNLPVPLTSFIGRELEMEEIKHLLSTTHLLTLAGAGGVGKTRLALQVGVSLVDSFKDGVWLVELAPISEPSLVTQEVVQTLGLQTLPGRSLILTLQDYFKPKQTLLILDNCEHLMDSCAALIMELLRNCPGLRILATSREAFMIIGEVTYRVPSLSLPNLNTSNNELELTLGELTQFGAVRLFIDRALAVQPGFSINDQNASAIAQICFRLDGIPLALELAAARLNFLSIKQILQHLDDRFRLLKGGNRMALPRQQTLKASIEWSYELLDEPEKKVFSRLAIFSGGWKLEAAESICSEGTVKPENILEIIFQLSNKSLILNEKKSGTDARFIMLETLRQYALERLRKSGEEEHIFIKHSHYYLNLLVEFTPVEEMEKGVRQSWLALVSEEIDNIRTALYRSIERNDLKIAFNLTRGLAPYWDWEGFISEAINITRKVLNRVENQLSMEETFLKQVKSLNLSEALGELKENLANWLMLTGHNEEALDLFQGLLLSFSTPININNLVWKARLIRKSGNTWRNRRDYTLALSLYKQAEGCLTSMEDFSNPARWVEWLNIQIEKMGLYYETNNLTAIEEILPETKSMLEQYGTPKQQGLLFPNAMFVYLARRDRYTISDEYVNYAWKMLEISREMGRITEVASNQFRLGFILLWHLDFEEAEQQLLGCLEIARKIEDLTLQTRCLTYLSIAARRKYQVALTQQYIDRLQPLLNNTHMDEYQGVCNANQGWIQRHLGNLWLAQKNLEEALDLWTSKGLTNTLAYPFQWLALWPLIAILLQRNEKEDVVQAYKYSRHLLLPDQQPLTPELVILLEGTRSEFEQGNLDSTGVLLNQALKVARDNNYL